MAVRLRRGAFWYYLEQIPKAPEIQAEKSCPLQHVPFDSVRKCAFRVLVYKDRIAVEFFHAVTDGTGGLIFLKTLLAEYLSEKYGINVPAEKGVLGRLEEPDEEELEDSFLRYAGDVKASGREADQAWHLERHAGARWLCESDYDDAARAGGEGVRKRARRFGDGASVRGNDAGAGQSAGGKGSAPAAQKARPR